VGNHDGQILALVPEPAVALLIPLGVLAGMRRRRS
jgi:hypothetical protein